MKNIIFGAVLAVGGVVLAMQAQTPDRREEKREEKRLVDSLEGQALFETYCAVCHGKDGKGGGPMAKTLKASPPDLTHVAMRYGGKFPLTQVQRIISGESEVWAHGTRDMPLWGPIFSQVTWDEDLGRVRIYNLAKYIEKIQAN